MAQRTIGLRMGSTGPKTGALIALANVQESPERASDLVQTLPIKVTRPNLTQTLTER